MRTFRRKAAAWSAESLPWFQERSKLAAQGSSNPNSKPCPVTLVSPTAQTYRVGAGGSGLEVLPLALCQYVSIPVPPRISSTQAFTLCWCEVGTVGYKLQIVVAVICFTRGVHSDWFTCQTVGVHSWYRSGVLCDRRSPSIR